LPKWKLFSRLKGKKDVSAEVEMRTQHFKESKEKPKISEIREESEELPIKEYNETLYSKGFIQKKPATMPSESKQSLKRSSWENLGTIEHNVDDFERKKNEVRGTRIQTSEDIDQKVDHILYKKKIKY